VAIESYTISTDTLNGVVDASSLHQEILAEGTITTTLNWVTVDVGQDLLEIDFVSALSGPELTALTAVVAAHTGVATFDPEEDSASPAGITLISGSTVSRYGTIADAITASSSGDVILIGPGTYAESFTVPANVTMQGAYGGGTTVISGSGATGTRITMSNGSSIRQMFVVLPTDATPAVSFAGGIGERANVSEIGLQGQGASGIGIQNSNSGAMIVDRTEYAAGTCDAVFEVSGGQLIISQTLMSSGTAADFIRVAGGSLIADSINVGFPPTVTDCLEVGAGAVVGSDFNFQTGTNGVHVTSDSANVQLRSPRLNASTFDILVDPGLTAGTFHIIGGELSESKISVPGAWAAEADQTFTFQDDSSTLTHDTALSIWGELHVGHPEAGAEAAFGRGDGYTRGMVVLTTDDTASPSSDGGNFTDVSAAAASGSGSTFTFQGVGAGHSILVASTLSDASDLRKIFGWQSTQTIGSIGGVYIFEIWDGSGWVEVGAHATCNEQFFSYANVVFLRTGSCENLRLGVTSSTTWATKTINGTNAYWSRVRITSAVSTLPVFQQWRLSDSRTAINVNGKLAFYGTALYRETLFGSGNIFGESGGVTDGNFSVGSGGLPTGWTHEIKNSVLNSSGDAIYTQFVLPKGICTAYPLRFRFYYGVNNNSSTTAPTVILSVLPQEVSGILVADPAGGSVPVARTDANTDTITANPGADTTLMLPETTVNKIHCIDFGVIDIADYYEGDSIFIRLELDDDGFPATDLFVVSLEVISVTWTLGEVL